MRERRSDGFTLIEAIVVVAILGVTAALGMPALINMMWRNKIDLVGTEAALHMQAARSLAIRTGTPHGVFADFTTNQLVTFRGCPPAVVPPCIEGVDDLPPGTDVPSNRFFELPTGITFQAPAEAPEGTGAVDGFLEPGTPPGGWVLFRADGSALMADETTTAGAFRYAAAEFGFFRETRVEPAATGRIAVRHWNGTEFIEPETPGGGG